MAETYLLGGRLPLLAPGDLSDGQQKGLYQRMRTHQVPWADRHNFKGMTGDDKLIGPFNPLLYSPEGGTGFLDFEAAEERSSSLDERVRQVVILSVGAVWWSAYEIYAHSAIARQAGLSKDTIQALQNGEPAKELTDKERLAQTYTLRLTSEHSVDATLYERAEHAFGRQGLVDIALLIGRYLTICTSQWIRHSQALTSPRRPPGKGSPPGRSVDLSRRIPPAPIACRHHPRPGHGRRRAGARGHAPHTTRSPTCSPSASPRSHWPARRVLPTDPGTPAAGRPSAKAAPSG